MKLSDGIITCPDTGECKIDINKIARCWGKDTFISRWHDDEKDDYRLCSGSRNRHIKVTISKADAWELVDKLGLVEVPIKPFRHGSSFMTKERRDRYEKAMKVPDLILNAMSVIMSMKDSLDDKETIEFLKGVEDSAKMLRKNYQERSK